MYQPKRALVLLQEMYGLLKLVILLEDLLEILEWRKRYHYRMDILGNNADILLIEIKVI